MDLGDQKPSAPHEESIDLWVIDADIFAEVHVSNLYKMHGSIVVWKHRTADRAIAYRVATSKGSKTAWSSPMRREPALAMLRKRVREATDMDYMIGHVHPRDLLHTRADVLHERKEKEAMEAMRNATHWGRF